MACTFLTDEDKKNLRDEITAYKKYVDGEVEKVTVGHEWNGTVLKITTGSGTSGVDLKGDPLTVAEVIYSTENGGENEVIFSDGSRVAVRNGERGAPGATGPAGMPGPSGYTPERGVDYWTEEDKAEIKAHVDKEIGGSVSVAVSEGLDALRVVSEKVINLYNKDDADEISNHIILNKNDILPYSGFCVTGYIPVKFGKTYSFVSFPAAYGWKDSGYVQAFDSDKNALNTLSGIIDADKVMHITIGDEAVRYIRTNVPNTISGVGGRDALMVVNSDTLPDVYIPYDGTDDTVVSLKPEVKIPPECCPTVTSPLHGKRVVFTGDSICEAITDTASAKGWAGRIGEKHSMIWTNNGVGGGTITSQTVLTGSPFCIAETDFGENPDYIILEGGTNDADYIGKGTDGNMPDNFGSYTMSNYGDFDTSTFCGAVEYLFKRVTTNYKGAKIGFIIAHKMGGWLGDDGSNTSYSFGETNTRRIYFDTIIALCKKWGIPYIDLWYGCYLNPMNPAHNSGDDPFYYNNDFQHLTAKGYDYITPMIEKWMETL